MAHSKLINEVATALQEVVSVISWTIVSAFPALLAVFISTVVTSLLIGAVFDSATEAPGSYIESSQAQTMLVSNAEKPVSGE